MKTGVAHDVFVGHDHLVRYWQHQLAKRHNNTGSRQSVCSTDLTSEFGSGFTPGFCFQAGERCERNLMQGMRSTAHKACTDEATYFLQTRMHLPYSDLVHTCDTSVCVSSCPFLLATARSRARRALSIC